MQEMKVQEIEITKIKPNPAQARRDFDRGALSELAQSIKLHGLQNPITLRPSDDGCYKIVSGERRFRAFKNLGLKTIPSIIREATPHETRVLSMIENVQRKDLNPMEEAEGLRIIIKDTGWSFAELGRQIGKNRKYIHDYISLTKLPKTLQDALRRVTIGASIALELGKIKNLKTRNKILKMAIDGKITRQEIRTLQKEPVEKPTREKELRQLWGKEPITKPTKKAESRIILKLGKLKITWG